MYYVENNRPAIIEREVFDRVREEVFRRNSKRKSKENMQIAQETRGTFPLFKCLLVEDHDIDKT